MAAISKKWNDYEISRDTWKKALVDLEKAKIVERESRQWEMNDKVRLLEALEMLKVKP